MRNSLPPRVKQIIEPLEAGTPLATLCAEFNHKTVNWALGALATLKPERYFKLAGQPASGHRILLDECAGAGLLEITRALFGQPLTLEFFAGKGTSDRDLFYTGRERGIATIFTRDGVQQSRKDLCKIAGDAYGKFHDNTDQRPVPGVIVLPHRHEQTLAVLSQNVDIVRAYIERHHEQLRAGAAEVLYLRAA